MQRKRVLLAGATGSIGRQAREVAAAFPDLVEIVGMTAHHDQAGLLAAAREFPSARLAFSGPGDLRFFSGTGAQPLSGKDAECRLIRESDADIVVNGIAGSAGLEPSLEALGCGKDLALANKESVVMAWVLLEAAAKKSHRRIIPVDSEHAALFQLLGKIPGVEELTITASGGAFRDRPLRDLASVRPDEAAAHPSWSMGRKISIDSATMANKGLEVIEASRLFNTDGAAIKVLIHPQSYVHALVRAKDGSLYANVSSPDMRLPILNSLVYPDTFGSSFGKLELAGKSLEFRAADEERYPMLYLAYEALSMGHGATVAYNAADEVAVEAFESGAIGFLDIARIVRRTLETSWEKDLPDIDAVFSADGLARKAAYSAIKELR